MGTESRGLWAFPVLQHLRHVYWDFVNMKRTNHKGDLQ